MLRRILSIRLSYIYPILFVLFLIGLGWVQPAELTAGQLALYSVNSFLFGFYFSPILGDQKTRVDNLIKTVRGESMVMLDILTQSHLLPAADRKGLKIRLAVYIDSLIDNRNVKADNIYYDELLYFTKQDKHKDDPVMNVIYERVSKTQDNRDALQNLLISKVFSHEWLVTLVLFSITVYFVMQTDYDEVLFFRVILAVLCTGLSLMVIILAKYATLTHKQAKRMWNPLKELREEHFEDVSHKEVLEMKHKINLANQQDT